MAAILFPIQEAGSTALQTYSEFQHYGLEATPTSATGDHAGPNEVLEFYRRVYNHAVVEHTASGVHSTLQIARLFLKATYTASGGYVPDGASYCMGTYQRDASVFTITAGGAGEITVDIGASYALPSADYRGADFSLSQQEQDTTYTRVEVNLRTITDSTTFVLRRREGSSLGGLALAHGDFAFAIYGA